MSAAEQYPLACQLIQMGSLYPRVASETTNPIVHVIDGDEEDISFRFRCSFGKYEGGKSKHRSAG